MPLVSHLYLWLRRLRLLLRRGRDAELREEMRLHREMLAAERGLSPAEAERAFGNELLLRERTRDVLGWTWVDDFFRDLKLALRQMRRAPGFTALAVVILALGIGANTAVFSVIEAALLHPLPYPHPERIVAFRGTAFFDFASGPSPWLTEVRALDAVAVYETGAINLAANLTGNSSGGLHSEQVRAAEVTSQFFRVMGVAPFGRSFAPADAAPGKTPVVVLSHRLARRLGPKSALIGSTILVNGRKATVIGVMPAGYGYPGRADVWMPFPIPWKFWSDPLMTGNTFLPREIGRLRAGVTPLPAQRAIAAAAHRNSPQAEKSARELTLVRLRQSQLGRAAMALWLLLGVAGLVLLIACANVATLQCTRGLARQKELAVRAALGAGRRRLFRQMLTESLLLAGFGGAAGIALAWLTLPLLRMFVPSGLALAAPISLDGRVLSAALLLSLGCGVLAGCFPALHAWGVNLRQASASLTGMPEQARMRHLRSGLTVTEIALTVVVLAGAVLLLHSFATLTSVKPGFDAGHLLTAKLSPGREPGYRKSATLRHFYEATLRRVDALPGVQSASFSNLLPMAPDTEMGVLLSTLEPRPSPHSPAMGIYHVVSPGFFPTLGIPLLSGRDFKASDNGSAPKVAIINRALAEALWPHGDPVGKHVAFSALPGHKPKWMRIVGVAGNAREALDSTPPEALYVPFGQQLPLSAYIEIRTPAGTTGRAASLAPALRRAVAGVDASQSVADVATERQRLDRSVASPRFHMLMLGLFAMLALALSAAGVFGVMAYSVTRRTSEIGIRMALGAQPAHVLRMIVGQGMRTVGLGIALGLAAATALAPLLRHLVYGVSVYDPATMAAAAALMALVGVLACYLPARRAAHLDPLQALRRE